MDDSVTSIDAVVSRIRTWSMEAVDAERIPTYTAAWAVLALTAHGEPAQSLHRLYGLLAQRQLDDGRVVVDLDLPEAYWPTALAALAFRTGGSSYGSHHAAAIGFLLQASGVHWPRSGRGISGHDPSIRGWSWVSATHSWVEPTSLAMIALKVAGHGDHPRVAEAVRMLLDRQLPAGGWNYGNTAVFGTTLAPIPEDTGSALAALAGSVEPHRVADSLAYLRQSVDRTRTPSTLSWSIHGLSAWGRRPEPARSWIGESLAREQRVGEYDIRLLSQLVVSYYATRGLVAWLADAP